MTRRTALEILLGSSAVSQINCRHSSSDICEKVSQIEENENLAILWSARRATNNGGILLANHVPLGEDAGKVCVAPNAQMIAWTPRLVTPIILTPATPLISLRAADRTTKRIMSRGQYTLNFAISDGGLALVLSQGLASDSTTRLVTCDQTTMELGRDFSSLVSGLPLSDVVTLSISGSGKRAAISTREQFAILDLVDFKMLLTGKGRSASLSPLGDLSLIHI